MTDDQDPASAPPAAPTPPTAPVPPPAIPVPPVKVHKKLARIVVGVTVAVFVLALKIGALAGIVGIFHHDPHKAGDAEQVVRTFLQSNTETAGDAELAGGSLTKVRMDGACATLTGVGSGAEFTVDSSAMDADGSAGVAVTLGGHKVDFHLVRTSGAWLIDSLTCP